MEDPSAELAAQMCQLGDHEAYLSAAGEFLYKLFPSEAIGWSALDAEARTAEIVAIPDVPLEGMAESLVDTAEENPFFISYVNGSPAGMWQPRRLSDLITDLELYRTRTYQEGLRPLGVDRQIALLAGRPGPVSMQVWTINRLRCDFTDHELELAGHLQPMLRLLERAYGGKEPREQAGLAEDHSLTARQHEILQFLGKGLTTAAIGHLLGISPRTVAKHLEHAYSKLGCTNRIDALRILSGG